MDRGAVTAGKINPFPARHADQYRELISTLAKFIITCNSGLAH